MKRASTVVVLGVLGLLSGVAAGAGPTTGPVREKVLILPFTAVVPDPGEAWIGGAIRQNLVSDVGRAKLFVASAPKDAQPVNDLEGAVKAGKDAGARYVLYGAYEVIQGNVRATGHLIDLRTELEVQPIRATGSVRDLFALEDALGDQVTRALPGIKTPMREAMLPRDNDQQQQQQQGQQQPMVQQPYAGQQPAGYSPYDTGYYDPGYDQPYYYPYTYVPYTYIRYPGRQHRPEPPGIPSGNYYQVPPNPFGIDYNVQRNDVRGNNGGTSSGGGNAPRTLPPIPPSPQPPAPQQGGGTVPRADATPRVQPGMTFRDGQGAGGDNGGSGGGRTAVDGRSR